LQEGGCLAAIFLTSLVVGGGGGEIATFNTNFILWTFSK